jgi:hypothetical protein
MGSNSNLLHKLKNQFITKWESHDLGEAKEFLGMRIIRDRSKKILTLDQEDYLEKVIKRFNVNGMKPAKTPMPQGYIPIISTEAPDPKTRTAFQQVIGSVLYLMLGTRPDIGYAVIKLSQMSANPTKEHLKRAVYIIQYLLSTRRYKLVYDGSKSDGLQGFCDSDWAQDMNDRRSQVGYVYELAQGSIFWSSNKQKSVALSSTEAEYMALCECVKQAKWVKTMLKELGFNLDHVPIVCDNQGSIFLSSNPVTEKRSKHIDIRYHYIRELVQDSEEIQLQFTPGDENRADLLTKNLGHVKFFKFRAELGLQFY